MPAADRPPSPRRIREARRQGHAPTAPLLLHNGATLAAALVLVMTAATLGERLMTFMRASLAAAFSPAPDAIATLRAAWSLCLDAVFYVGSAALITTLLLAFLISGGPLRPSRDGSTTAPTSYAIRLLSLLVLALITASTVRSELHTVLSSQPASGGGMIQAGVAAIGRIAVRILAAALVLGLIDAFLRRRRWLRQLQLTRTEEEAERRQESGDPAVRAAQRQALQQPPVAADDDH